MNEPEIYYTNSLDALARQLADDLCAEPLSALVPETVIVPSEGMAYWLRLRLASLTGCAAGLTMLFPGNFCQQLTRNPAQAQPKPEDLLWEIYAFLTDAEFVAGWPELSAYLQDHDPLKPLQLARRLCRLFNDYLVFRHEKLLRWEQGECGGLAQEGWQAALWGKLRAAPRAADFQRLLDRPEDFSLPPRLSIFGAGTLPPLFLELLRRIALTRPVRLYLPVPTPHFWADIRSGRELLRRSLREAVPELADRTAVWRAPTLDGAAGDFRPLMEGGAGGGRNALTALEEWLHYDCGNPLLADMGRQGREFFSLLSGVSQSGQEWHELTWARAPAQNVLGVLQNDIRDLHWRGREAGGGQRCGDRLPLDPADASLELHCCHSPLREVEVLHDRLLAALAEDPQLQPSDILVLLTSPADYAPWVRAVFGSSPVLSRQYRLADHSAAESNPVAKALLEILALPAGRQEAGEVLGLLDHEPVREAAGIADSDLSVLRELVRELNIRWGMDGATREREQGLPVGDANSWKAGLDRLLMGYATGNPLDGGASGVGPRADTGISTGGGNGLVCGIAPCFPGTAFELVGKFADWVQRLFRWCGLLAARSRPLEEWRKLLSRLCRELLGETGSDDDTGDWLQLPPLAGGVEAPLEAVREYLNGTLQAEGGRGAFLGGGVSFCALRPLRSVPFKVIAVLGLDYTRFPRRDRREAFDLMRSQPRPGDRSQREDDCQLFLETILSARHRLLLSYSGRSDTDLSIRPPAVCVSQLLDAVDHSFLPVGGKKPSQILTVQHPLQPFSPRYFHTASTVADAPEDARLFTFSSLYQPPSRSADILRQPFSSGALLSAVAETMADIDTLHVELDDLIRFWTHPVRWFCEKALKAFFPREEEELPEEEPVMPAGLERLRIRRTLVDHRLAASDPAAHLPESTERAALTAAGLLPPRELGGAWYGCLRAEAEDFVERLGPVAYQPPRPFRLILGQMEIFGRLSHLTAEQQVLYRPSNLSPADRLGAWLRHLALCALPEGSLPARCVRRTRLLGLTEELTLPALAATDATAQIGMLLTEMQRGQTQPLAFFVRSSYAYAAQAWLDAKKNTARAGSAARVQWLGSDFGGATGEGKDAYLRLCYPSQLLIADVGAENSLGGEPVLPVDTPEFRALALSFWQPYFSALEANS